MVFCPNDIGRFLTFLSLWTISNVEVRGNEVQFQSAGRRRRRSRSSSSIQRGLRRLDGEKVDRCYPLLTQADADRNGRIDSSEYLQFAHLLGLPNTIDDIPLPFRSRFNYLACQCHENGGTDDCCNGDKASINLNQVATDDVYFHDVCFLTSLEVITFAVLSTAPSPVPTIGTPLDTTASPTVVPSSVTISPSILPKTDIPQSSPEPTTLAPSSAPKRLDVETTISIALNEVDGINVAYRREIVQALNVLQLRRRRRLLRPSSSSRSLQSTVRTNAAEIIQETEIPCPSTRNNTDRCLAVQVRLSIPNSIDNATTKLNTAITDGALQQVVTEMNARSHMTILGVYVPDDDDMSIAPTTLLTIESNMPTGTYPPSSAPIVTIPSSGTTPQSSTSEPFIDGGNSNSGISDAGIIVLIILGVLALGMFAGLAFYKFRRRRREKSKEEMDKDQMESLCNSHDENDYVQELEGEGLRSSKRSLLSSLYSLRVGSDSSNGSYSTSESWEDPNDPDINVRSFRASAPQEAYNNSREKLAHYHYGEDSESENLLTTSSSYDLARRGADTRLSSLEYSGRVAESAPMAPGEVYRDPLMHPNDVSYTYSIPSIETPQNLSQNFNALGVGVGVGIAVGIGIVAATNTASPDKQSVTEDMESERDYPVQNSLGSSAGWVHASEIPQFNPSADHADGRIVMPLVPVGPLQQSVSVSNSESSTDSSSDDDSVSDDDSTSSSSSSDSSSTEELATGITNYDPKTADIAIASATVLGMLVSAPSRKDFESSDDDCASDSKSPFAAERGEIGISMAVPGYAMAASRTQGSSEIANDDSNKEMMTRFALESGAAFRASYSLSDSSSDDDSSSSVESDTDDVRTSSNVVIATGSAGEGASTFGIGHGNIDASDENGDSELENQLEAECVDNDMTSDDDSSHSVERDTDAVLMSSNVVIAAGSAGERAAPMSFDMDRRRIEAPDEGSGIESESQSTPGHGASSASKAGTAIVPSRPEHQVGAIPNNQSTKEMMTSVELGSGAALRASENATDSSSDDTSSSSMESDSDDSDAVHMVSNVVMAAGPVGEGALHLASDVRAYEDTKGFNNAGSGMDGSLGAGNRTKVGDSNNCIPKSSSPLSTLGPRDDQANKLASFMGDNSSLSNYSSVSAVLSSSAGVHVSATDGVVGDLPSVDSVTDDETDSHDSELVPAPRPYHDSISDYNNRQLILEFDGLKGSSKALSLSLSSLEENVGIGRAPLPIEDSISDLQTRRYSLPSLESNPQTDKALVQVQYSMNDSHPSTPVSSSDVVEDTEESTDSEFSRTNSSASDTFEKSEVTPSQSTGIGAGRSDTAAYPNPQDDSSKSRLAQRSSSQRLSTVSASIRSMSVARRTTFVSPSTIATPIYDRNDLRSSMPEPVLSDLFDVERRKRSLLVSPDDDDDNKTDSSYFDSLADHDDDRMDHPDNHPSPADSHGLVEKEASGADTRQANAGNDEKTTVRVTDELMWDGIAEGSIVSGKAPVLPITVKSVSHVATASHQEEGGSIDEELKSRMAEDVWGAIAEGSVSAGSTNILLTSNDNLFQWALGQSLSRLETAYQVGELELPPGIEFLSESSSESADAVSGGLDDLSSTSSSSLSTSGHSKRASVRDSTRSIVLGYESSEGDDDYVFEG